MIGFFRLLSSQFTHHMTPQKSALLDIFLKSHRQVSKGEKIPVIQGQLLDFSPKDKTPRSVGPDEPTLMRGDRKASLSFSGSSARRLSRLLASLSFKGAIFLTLTQSPGKTPQEAKLALDCFFKQLKRDAPLASAIWRMEKQQNGSPHFHILVFGLSLECLFKWNPCDQWRDQIGCKVSPSCINMQYINTNTGAFLYIVGHGTKKNQTWPGQAVGRYWGKHNNANLPYAEEKQIIFQPGEKEFLRRYWERSEARRVKWLSIRYPCNDYSPRSWEFSGPLKLYSRPVSELLRVWKYVSRYCQPVEFSVHKMSGNLEIQFIFDF